MRDMREDTIAAISTAPGRAGLAVVRVSGPAVGRIAVSVGLPELPPRRAVLGHLRHPEDGRAVDRVVATRFAAPASYTGEEVLEISCHGGSLVPQLVLDALLAAGAREAERGEFAKRAYLNGKLDLVQAEATLDLIDARSEAAHRVALFQLDGGLSRRIEALRRRLLALQAALSYEIDFPEEDDGPIDPARIEEAANALEAELEALRLQAPDGELLREGALTVIAGRPNSGKSSLFNALLGKSRAIVTDRPGTTRDAIEAVISIEGYPFRLVDTAGLRKDADSIEEIGIEVAHRYLENADLVVFCVEVDRPLGADEAGFICRQASRRRTVVVRTKSDRVGPKPGDRQPGPAARGDDGVPGGVSRMEVPEGVARVEVSAVRGHGLDGLRELLLDAVFSGVRCSEETPLITRRRQARRVERALEETRAFRAARAEGLPAEIATTHLQEAVAALEEIVGIVDVEDVLDVVFSSFCVGK